MRREWPLRRAALKRQTPDVGVSADFDNGEPFKPLGAKKLLIEGTARHRLGRREIKFARDAAAHEHGKGWRLARNYWGRGYATEGAQASLADGFGRLGL